MVNVSVREYGSERIEIIFPQKIHEFYGFEAGIDNQAVFICLECIGIG